MLLLKHFLSLLNILTTLITQNNGITLFKGDICKALLGTVGRIILNILRKEKQMLKLKLKL